MTHFSYCHAEMVCHIHQRKLTLVFGLPHISFQNIFASSRPSVPECPLSALASVHQKSIFGTFEPLGKQNHPKFPLSHWKGERLKKCQPKNPIVSRSDGVKIENFNLSHAANQQFCDSKLVAEKKDAHSFAETTVWCVAWST